MEARPIPALYCCYLLRSTVRHSSLYVGSTPEPRRRLAQHNGQVKGGATRTSRTSLQPWEMTCIVAGFPSNIAALQFEWAWQNAHITRHIPAEERVSSAVTRTKYSEETGKARRRPARPRMSLIDTLSNLHLLLRVPYFSKWPLELRFFSNDVYQSWSTWSQRVDRQIPASMKVLLDTAQPAQESEACARSRKRKHDMVRHGGVNGVDSTYSSLRSVLEKSQFLLEEDNGLRCTLCEQVLQSRMDLITVCPNTGCQSFNHMTCLSSHFLKTDAAATIVPVSGKCPGCSADLSWFDLMKAMTLRVRDEMKIRKILKARKRVPITEPVREHSLEVDDLDELDRDQAIECALTAADIADDASCISNESDDAASVTSAGFGLSHMLAPRTTCTSEDDTRLPIVIEDSDEEAGDLSGVRVSDH
jgi:structure-specific endonuclease subunit SLX1